MSENSQNLEIEEESVFSSSTIESEDSGFVDNLLVGISMNNDFESSIDPLLFSRSSVPDITIFPSSVRFPTCFPHTKTSQRITVSNGGSIEETFKVSLTGDSEYKVDKSEITVQPGTTSSVTVEFEPSCVSLFQGALVFEGRMSPIVTLTGHCMPSPLDLPPQNSKFWHFQNTSCERSIPISNRSFSMALVVDFSANSDAFEIVPSRVNLPAGTRTEIKVIFNPKKLSKRDDPIIHVVSPKTGEEFDIELNMEGPRSCMTVDFGPVSVGNVAVKPVTLKSPQVAPVLQWPFHIANADENGIEQSILQFSFLSDNEGVFQERISFKDFDIQLIATAVPQPYRLHISSKFPAKPIIVRNMDDRPIKFRFSATPSNCIIDVEEALLRAKESVRIHLIYEDNLEEQPELVIIWNTENGRAVTDTIALPYNKPIRANSDDNTELSVKEMEDKSELSRIDETPDPEESTAPATPKTRVSPVIPHELSPEKLTCSVPIVASCDLITFFGVSARTPVKSSVTIVCDEPFTIIAPEHISFDDEYCSGKAIELTCFECPQLEEIDYLKVYVKGELGLKIPIVSYQDSSRVEFDRVVPIDGFQAALEVKNVGERAAFVLVTVDKGDVDVTPKAMILQPYESNVVSFTFESEPEKASISLIYGDEFIRQLRAALRPSDPLAKLFASLKTSSELAVVSKVLMSRDRLELAALLRKCLMQTRIRFVTNVHVTFTPAVLDFEGVDESRRLTITNSGLRSLNVEIACDDEFVDFKPASCSLAADSDTQIAVTLRAPEQAILKVSCNGDVLEVPLRFAPTISTEIISTAFVLDQSQISFGEVDMGLSETRALKIQNLSNDSIELDLELQNKSAFRCVPKIFIDGNTEVAVEIEFSPFKRQTFEETLIVRHGEVTTSVLLKGIGIVEQDDTVLSQGDLLVFPPCEPGLIRRAKVKVVNKTSKRSEIRAAVKAPFFCPVQEFCIEKRSFVLFPVHFLPKQKGNYEATLEFMTNRGKTTVIDVRGVCE